MRRRTCRRKRSRRGCFFDRVYGFLSYPRRVQQGNSILSLDTDSVREMGTASFGDG